MGCSLEGNTDILGTAMSLQYRRFLHQKRDTCLDDER